MQTAVQHELFGELGGIEISKITDTADLGLQRGHIPQCLAADIVWRLLKFNGVIKGTKYFDS